MSNRRLAQVLRLPTSVGKRALVRPKEGEI